MAKAGRWTARAWPRRRSRGRWGAGPDAMAAVVLGAWLMILSVMTAAATSVSLDAVEAEDVYGFDDSPRAEPLEHPAWFKASFLDLRADLAEAVAAGKKGLIVYFGQPRCAYCQKLLSVNFGSPDIVDYIRRHFEVVALDIWGIDEVTDLAGVRLSERDLAKREGTDFTPALLFYDARGQLVLRLRGYYPPYQFRAALEYVADGHDRRESFRDYLARGDNRMVFDEKDLNTEPFFDPPPFDLDRRYPSDRPLAVFFEQGDCHACDVLHGQALREPDLQGRFATIDNVQLDLHAATPVVTPSGRRTTARDWATELGLFYTPTLLFFDEQGREFLRVDSVVGFYRLRQVMDFIRSGAWHTDSFGGWRARGRASGGEGWDQDG